METRAKMRVETTDAPSETSLERWKRPFRDEPVDCVSSSETSLEGWKLMTGSSAPLPPMYFRNFLRGMETRSLADDHERAAGELPKLP